MPNKDKGVVKSGILDAKAIGDNSSGSIFHLIALEFGTKIALLSKTFAALFA